MIQRELTTSDYIRILRRRWFMVVILTLVGGPLAYGVSRVIPSRYKSTSLVLVEEPAVSDDVVQAASADLGQQLSSMQQQMLSRTGLEPIIHQFNLYPKDIDRVPMDQLVTRLRTAIDVSPVAPMAQTRANNLPGFSVTVTLDDPQTAQAVCTTITSMFIEESLRLSQSHTDDTVQFLNQQVQEAKTKLDDQSQRLAAFKTKYLGTLPDQQQTNINLLASLNSQLDAQTQALSSAQQQKTYDESLLSDQLASWQSAQTGQSPETYEQQLQALQTQLASLQGRYTDDYPDVIKVKRDITTLKKKIADTQAAQPDQKAAGSTVEPPQILQLRAQIHTLDLSIAEHQKEEDQIRQSIDVYEKRIQSTPDVEAQYEELTRDNQTAVTFYNDLLKRRDQAVMNSNLQREQQGEHFRTLDPANLPDAPSFPNRPRFAMMGFAGGLGLGLGLAFFFEMRDTSFRSERDIEHTLRLPVLAMVPAVEGLSSRKIRRKAVRVAPGMGLGERA